MPRLILVFAGRTLILLVLSRGGSYDINVSMRVHEVLANESKLLHIMRTAKTLIRLTWTNVVYYGTYRNGSAEGSGSKVNHERRRRRVIRALGYGAEGRRFASRSGQNTGKPSTQQRMGTWLTSGKVKGGERRGLGPPFTCRAKYTMGL